MSEPTTTDDASAGFAHHAVDDVEPFARDLPAARARGREHRAGAPASALRAASEASLEGWPGY